MRWLRRLVLALVLGAIVAHGVAVVGMNELSDCQAGWDLDREGFVAIRRTAFSDRVDWEAVRPKAWECNASIARSLWQIALEKKDLWPSRPLLSCSVGMEEYFNAQPMIIQSSGWPMRSAWCWRGVRGGVVPRGSLIEQHGGAWYLKASRPKAREGLSYEGFYVIPYWIIPLGFVANAAAYGATGWAVLSVPTVLRWALRRRAGVCRGCGYALTGLPSDVPCPECGRRRSTRAAQPSRASG